VEPNPSRVEPVRLLQLWVLPDRQSLTPVYEQRNFIEADRRGAKSFRSTALITR
jgi:redox-sensitive bicupin YhaK (pirin superfamily)